MSTKPILLVEDNRDDEALAMRAFRKMNIRNRIVVARDGVEALDHLHGSTASDRGVLRPAMVLLDLNLPKIDGIQVLKRIRADQRTRLIPVVILTSSKEQPDIVEGYGCGANSYVRKPIDFDDFLHVVGQLGMYWLLLNESPDSH